MKSQIWLLFWSRFPIIAYGYEEIRNRSTKYGQNQANFFWKYFYENFLNILDQKYSFKTKMGIIFILIVRSGANKNC